VDEVPPSAALWFFDKELDEKPEGFALIASTIFPSGARERIHSLVETCTFEEMDADMTSVDVLSFTGAASYTSKLEKYRKSTGLKDAVITGIGKLGEQRIALGVMDFSFSGRLDGVGRGARRTDAG